MNYKKIYDSLMDRARNRTVEEYTENHHIVPRCMGGLDEEENLVKLTGREHYIAHQILVKIHPGNHALVKAANYMCSINEGLCGRSKNRLYDWIRRKLSMAMSESQKGDGNSQYGKVWIFNYEKKLNKKIDPNELALYISLGWSKGRKISWATKKCLECETLIDATKKRNYCCKECRSVTDKKSVFDGREQELINLYRTTGNLNKSLKLMGIPGAMGGWYHQAMKILNTEYAPVSPPTSNRSLKA